MSASVFAQLCFFPELNCAGLVNLSDRQTFHDLDQAPPPSKMERQIDTVAATDMVDWEAWSTYYRKLKVGARPTSTSVLKNKNSWENGWLLGYIRRPYHTSELDIEQSAIIGRLKEYCESSFLFPISSLLLNSIQIILMSPWIANNVWQVQVEVTIVIKKSYTIHEGNAFIFWQLFH